MTQKRAVQAYGANDVFGEDVARDELSSGSIRQPNLIVCADVLGLSELLVRTTRQQVRGCQFKCGCRRTRQGRGAAALSCLNSYRNEGGLDTTMCEGEGGDGVVGECAIAPCCQNAIASTQRVDANARTV